MLALKKKGFLFKKRVKRFLKIIKYLKFLIFDEKFIYIFFFLIKKKKLEKKIRTYIYLKFFGFIH